MLQEFVQAISDLVDKKLNNLHTAIPGKIVSYDASTGLATVLPVMKFRKPDGSTIDFPQITGVPVILPQAVGQQVTIAYPIKADDGCLIIVAEQSIDYWMYGQETDTDLKFDLTNAFCIPGLFVSANKITEDACKNNSIILDAKGTRISVKKGEVHIGAANVIIDGNLKVNGKIESE